MDSVRAAKRQTQLRERYYAAHARMIAMSRILEDSRQKDKVNRAFEPSRATLEAEKRYALMKRRRERAWRRYTNWMERTLPLLIEFVIEAGVMVLGDGRGAVLQLRDDGSVHVYYGGIGEPNGQRHGHIEVFADHTRGYSRNPTAVNVDKKAVELAS